MLNFMSKQIEIASPVSGTVVNLDQVNDAVFSGRSVGDGCAVIPEDPLICAPCDGKIIQIIETNHAFCILSDDGLEILVHIGLDTVQLKGEGFSRLKEEGEQVKTGDPVMKVDFSYLRQRGKEIVTPVLITNMDQVALMKIFKGKVRTAERLIKVKMK
ncbi:PTS glucose transporter subunit IIA [Caproicibacter sp.]|uniref:PTS sugar transporter subunit IIA n=1 Tax=Caproicibacter sp. TaxID=2814884 RepID=UPI0039891BB6